MSHNNDPEYRLSANGLVPDGQVPLAFEHKCLSLRIDTIVPLKVIRDDIRQSRKYAQILCSIKAIGLVECPVVIADPRNPDRYFLLDGHLRIEALKDLEREEVECILATDEDTYTYNKRINRLPPVQEHRMIVRAIERGVDPAKIAEALGLEVASIRRRFRLLDGICTDAAEMLKDTNCSMKVFDILRQMSPLRQIEAADLMVGQNNFTVMFARALLAATPGDQLVGPARKGAKNSPSPNSEQIARMERELAALQSQIKSVEDTYGIDNLHLTVTRGYIVRLLGNAAIARWLSRHRQEYLAEFQRIAEIETLGTLEPVMEPG